jgi:hypothetical protein
MSELGKCRWAGLRGRLALHRHPDCQQNPCEWHAVLLRMLTAETGPVAAESYDCSHGSYSGLSRHAANRARGQVVTQGDLSSPRLLLRNSRL